MALTEYTLPAITAKSGTYSVTLYCDTAALTKPTSSTITGISEIIERPEDSVGVFSLPQMTISIQDDYTVYSQGFWYKVMNDSSEVQLWIRREEGVTQEHFFWGYSQDQFIEWDEAYVPTTPTTGPSGSQFIRRGRITVVSMLGKLADASLSSIVTEFLTHDVAADQPEPTNLALVVNNAGGDEYSYTVRAVYGNGNSPKSSTVNTTASATPQDNDLTWDAMPGATAIVVYRDVDTGGGGGTGQIAVLAGTATAYTDTGAAGGADGYATSGYLYGSFEALIASMIKVAYSQAYSVGDVEFPNTGEQDLQFNNSTGGTTQYIDDIYFQTNDGSNNSPYLDSSDDSYWPDRYDPLQLLGALCRNFGVMARHYYNVGSSVHRIQLITRGTTYGTAVTMDGSLMESNIYNGHDLSFQGVKVIPGLVKDASGVACTLATDQTKVTVTSASHGYSNGDIIELENARPEKLNTTWVVANSAANTFDLTNSANYRYVVSVGVILKPGEAHEILTGRGPAKFNVACEFVAGVDNDGGIFDTGGWDVIHFKSMEATDDFFAPSVIFWHKYSDNSDPSETTPPEFVRALAQYYQDRFNSYGKVHERTYDKMTATLSGTSSHLNVTPYHKVSINDGTGAANYLITETRYNPDDDTVYLQMVEET